MSVSERGILNARFGNGEGSEEVAVEDVEETEDTNIARNVDLQSQSIKVTYDIASTGCHSLYHRYHHTC